jgi:hypothetical protein
MYGILISILFTNAFSNLGSASVVEAVSVIAVLMELYPISLYFFQKINDSFDFLESHGSLCKKPTNAQV